jgi:hypothetical protein
MFAYYSFCPDIHKEQAQKKEVRVVGQQLCTNDPNKQTPHPTYQFNELNAINNADIII